MPNHPHTCQQVDYARTKTHLETIKLSRNSQKMGRNDKQSFYMNSIGKMYQNQCQHQNLVYIAKVNTSGYFGPEMGLRQERSALLFCLS